MTASTGDDRRRTAYREGARVARTRMQREAPLDAEALARLEAADVLVVPGSYDHVELVLDSLGTPYTRVDVGELEAARLRPEQLLVVNCPGHVSPRSIDRIRGFVAGGGSLFTTDWALRHVLEPAFPGVVAYNDRPTRDEVVRVEVHEHDNPYLDGVMDGSDDPVWWLEGSSYPIRVLGEAEVLIASRELAERYGESPVALLFRHEGGEVLHMVSHYYLQRTELRTARHRVSAATYAAEKDVPASPEAAGLSLGDVESAQTSARFLANVMAQKKRRQR